MQGEIVLRTCKKCGETKPIEEFVPHKQCNPPFEHTCMICRLNLSKIYAAINKDKIKQYKKEYHLKNRDKLLKKKRNYYNDNKDNILLKNKTYRKIHKEQIKLHGQQYRLNNKELIKYRKQKYYQEHRHQVIEYRVNHRSHINEIHRMWYEKNKNRYKKYYYTQKSSKQFLKQRAERERARSEKLTDRYIISLIKKKTRLGSITIRRYPKLIELGRQNLIEHRTIKQLQQSLKSLQNETSTNS